MSQRKLFVSALALTLAIGGSLLAYRQIGVDAAAWDEWGAVSGLGSKPKITKIDPASGPVGTVVTITGNNFHKKNNKINFAGADAFTTLPSKGGKIVLTVPATPCSPGSVCAQVVLSPGEYPLSVTVGKKTSNEVIFTVTKDESAEPDPKDDKSADGDPEKKDPADTAKTEPVPAGQPIVLVQVPVRQKDFPKAIHNLPDMGLGRVRLDLLQATAIKDKLRNSYERSFFGRSYQGAVKFTRFDPVWKAVEVTAPTQQSEKGPFRGKNKGSVDSKYVISHAFSTHETNATEWKLFTFGHKVLKKERLKVYYRISDDITQDPKAADWISIDLSKLSKKTQDCGPYLCSDEYITLVTTDNKVAGIGKYFQYKIHMDDRSTRVHSVFIIAQPLSAPSDPADPDPKDPKDPDPTDPKDPADPPIETGEGTISISSLYIPFEDTSEDGVSPSPSPSSLAILPSVAPTASPSTAPTDYTDLCFDKSQDIEAAANIKLSLLQKTNIPKDKKPIKLEDQRTDEDGEWQGVAEQKVFPVGTYEIKFGEFDNSKYKLVAFCDAGTGALIKTQSDISARKATIRVKADQDAELVALYARRDKPYISMEKFAVPSTVAAGASRRVLNYVYPGMSFTYLVKYTNTGDKAAAKLVIQDVIPAQYTVDESILDDPSGGFKMEPDSRGGTLVTKTIGDLAIGASGWVSIPVTLKADAFADQNSTGSLLGDF